jgi:hypothetical protein
MTSLLTMLALIFGSGVVLIVVLLALAKYAAEDM